VVGVKGRWYENSRLIEDCFAKVVKRHKVQTASVFAPMRLRWTWTQNENRKTGWRIIVCRLIALNYGDSRGTVAGKGLDIDGRYSRSRYGEDYVISSQ
jgi:hypothetical protein